MNTRKNNIGVENKTIEPNIFALFYKKAQDDRKTYIGKCVDAYPRELTEEKRVFLKAFLSEVLELFESEVTSNPEHDMAEYIRIVSDFTLDMYKFIYEKSKHGEEYIDLLKKLDGVDVCDVVADFLADESSVEKISVSEFPLYDDISKRTILLFHGEHSDSINESISDVLRQNIKDLIKKDTEIDSEVDEMDEIREEVNKYLKKVESDLIVPDLPVPYTARINSYNLDGNAELDDQAIRELKGKLEDIFWAEIDIFLEKYTPKKIIAFLDERIHGQHEVKKACAVHLYDHIMRCKYPNKIKKKNVLLIMGAPGSGKTEIFRALNEISPVPLVIRDAGDITSRGYVGADIVNIIKNATGGVKFEGRGSLGKDLKKIYSMIVLDEFDELIKPSTNSSYENVSLEIQSALLYALEDGILTDTSGNTLDAHEVGFVCVGAFVGIENILRGNVIGFNSNEKAGAYDMDVKKALIKYGMMPELCSRISKVRSAKKLNMSDMVQILKTKSMSPITQLKTEYELNNILIELTDECISKVAQIAYESGLGARSMLGIIRDASETKYIDALEEDGNRRITITESDVSRVMT